MRDPLARTETGDEGGMGFSRTPTAIGCLAALGVGWAAPAVAEGRFATGCGRNAPSLHLKATEGLVLRIGEASLESAGGALSTELGGGEADLLFGAASGLVEARPFSSPIFVGGGAYVASRVAQPLGRSSGPIDHDAARSVAAGGWPAGEVELGEVSPVVGLG
ncbi:MAG: hypothetical protein AAGL49_15170, partial [Pseudomonadota bacterium]